MGVDPDVGVPGVEKNQGEVECIAGQGHCKYINKEKTKKHAWDSVPVPREVQLLLSRSPWSVLPKRLYGCQCGLIGAEFINVTRNQKDHTCRREDMPAAFSFMYS